MSQRCAQEANDGMSKKERTQIKGAPDGKTGDVWVMKQIT